MKIHFIANTAFLPDMQYVIPTVCEMIERSSAIVYRPNQLNIWVKLYMYVSNQAYLSQVD